MNKDVFMDTMSRLKSLQERISVVDEALRGLCTDFNGFYIDNIDQLVIDVVHECFHYKGDMIYYFIYDLQWGAGWKKDCVTADGKDIKLKTLTDLYNYLIKEKNEVCRCADRAKHPSQKEKC